MVARFNKLVRWSPKSTLVLVLDLWWLGSYYMLAPLSRRSSLSSRFCSLSSDLPPLWEGLLKAGYEHDCDRRAQLEHAGFSPGHLVFLRLQLRQAWCKRLLPREPAAEVLELVDGSGSGGGMSSWRTALEVAGGSEGAR